MIPVIWIGLVTQKFLNNDNVVSFDGQLQRGRVHLVVSDFVVEKVACWRMSGAASLIDIGTVIYEQRRCFGPIVVDGYSEVTRLTRASRQCISQEKQLQDGRVLKKRRVSRDT